MLLRSAQVASAVKADVVQGQTSNVSNDSKSVQAKRRPVMPDISINLTGQSVKTEQKHEERTVVQNQRYSHEQLLKVWRDYTLTIPTKTILVNTMKSCLPQISEENKIVVFVENRAQVSDLESEKTNLIPYLRKVLSNSYISIDIYETQKGENRKFLSPKEKYKEMAEENPDLIYLKDVFNLEMA